MTLTPEIKNYFDELNCGVNNLITSDDLLKRVENKENLYLLDIRKKEDFDEKHIPTAKHCPWSKVGELIENGTLTKDQPIIVICYSGQTAGQTVGILKALGYQACSLKGGMNIGWQNDNLPLEATCGA